MLVRCSAHLRLITHIHALSSRQFAVVGRKSKNVAAKKNKHDALRTKLFQRLGVKILMSAKKGGADPDKNIELARALKEAYSVSLPKDNIERALKKATEVNNGSDDDYKPGDYEVFGFGGVGIVVRTLTDNPNRAVAQIKAVARKQEVKMASAGSVLFLFDLKGIIHLQPAATTPTNTSTSATTTTAATTGGGAAAAVSEERLLEIALDSGVDDVDVVYPPADGRDSDSDSDRDDNSKNSNASPSSPSSTSSSPSSSSPPTISQFLTVVTSPEYLGILQDALAHQLSAQTQGGNGGGSPGSGSSGGDSRRVGDTPVAVTVTGELGYIPKGGELVRVSEEDGARNLELIEIFEELEDVDRVYHNMDTRSMTDGD